MKEGSLNFDFYMFLDRYDLQIRQDILVQLDGEKGSCVSRSDVQSLHNAERREAVPVKLPKVVPRLGGQEWSDHHARRAAEETARDRVEHDAARAAQVPLLEGHSACHG